MQNDIKMPYIHSGIFFISLATLLFELGLTRVFSIAQWYHFAFMVISLALLGFGISGSALSIFSHIYKRDISYMLSLFSSLFCISCLASYLLINNLPFDSFRIAWELKQIAYLALYYISLAIPFFFSGLCTGIAITRMPSHVHKLYFWNLAGSGLGCLLILVLIPIKGNPCIVIFVILFGILATFLFTRFRLIKSVRSIIFITCMITLWVTFNPELLDITMSPYKSLQTIMRFPDTSIPYTKWNAFSRVDIIQSKSIKYAPGLSYKYPGMIPYQMGITTDGDNLSALTHTDYSLKDAGFTDFLPAAQVYRFHRPDNMLIINPGGGMDVLSGLYHHSRHITVLEANPLISKLLKNEFAEFTGNIYNRHNVQVYSEGVRSFIRRSKKHYDIIQISLSDTYGAVTTGALSLRENYLYTTNAFQEYIELLSPDGFLVITRWLQHPPSESLKIGTTIISALETIPYSSPASHIIALRSLMTGTYIVKKSPFTVSEIESLKTFCAEMKFDIIYFPGISPEWVNRYNVLEKPMYYNTLTEALSSQDRQQFFSKYIYNINPATDDRPFFFNFYKAKNISLIIRNFGKHFEPYAGGGYLVLVILLCTAFITSLIFIMLPLYIFKRKNLHFPYTGRFFSYFFCLGLGFLFIEIPLMHKFVIFLNHPIYAFSAVLSGILIFSGLGSISSHALNTHIGFKKILLLLCIGILIYMFFLDSIFNSMLDKSFPIRLFASLIIIAPLGFLMGIPFPTGIEMVNVFSPGLTPWVWGINGFASVLSSIIALMVAMKYGYTSVLMLACIMYLLSLLFITRLPRLKGQI